jgi:MFS family permease
VSETNTVETQVPARIDRLPWSRFHTLVVSSLGVAWILDGIEVMIVANISSVLTNPASGLGLTNSQVGYAAAIYSAGAALGGLLFSYLTDRYGRRKLFFITLSIYLIFTILTAFSWGFFSFVLFRFFTGVGIGGEYPAIHSAIDEFVPARVRGQTSLTVNSTYWVGAALASLMTVAILTASFIPTFYGWRLVFAVGGALSLLILLTRRFVPESPRWLMTHGKADEAEEIAANIEENVRHHRGGEELPEVDEDDSITVEQREAIGFGPIARAMFQMYPKRTILGIVLMSCQTFMYNAIFFTYALILATFFGVPEGTAGYYIFGLAIASLLGPLTLGRLFDRVGRRPMITGCFATSGVLIALIGYLYAQGIVTSPVTQTALFGIMFFFASAGSSASYLTGSEIFPMELRAMALGVFYAIAMAVGGIAGPAIYGRIIDTGDPWILFIGYLIAGILLIVAAITELLLGVNAEQQSLEDVAAPLSAIQQETASA